MFALYLSSLNPPVHMLFAKFVEHTMGVTQREVTTYIWSSKLLSKAVHVLWVLSPFLAALLSSGNASDLVEEAATASGLRLDYEEQEISLRRSSDTST